MHDQLNVERYRGIVYCKRAASKRSKTDNAQYVDLITAVEGFELKTDHDVWNWGRTLHGKRTYT